MSTSDEQWEEVKRAWANGETVQWRELDHKIGYSLWRDWTDTGKIDRDLGEWRVKPKTMQFRLLIHREPCVWAEAQMKSRDCRVNEAMMLYVGPWVEVEMP